MISAIVPFSDRRYYKNLRQLLKYPEIREIIVLDSSGSSDIPNMKESDCRFKFIIEENFDHGGTRNKGARVASGKILLFMTQDSIPYGENFAKEIINSFSGKIGAVYGRHIADKKNPFEFIERKILYPDYTIVKRYKPKMKFQDFFVSDVCFAVDRDIFQSVGGFPENIISSEELILSMKILMSGFEIMYNPNICVLHTHNDGFLRSFKRWFDVGVFFSFYPDAREGFFGFAVKLFLKEFSYFLMKNPQLCAQLFLRAFVRAVGISAGMNWRIFGKYSYYLSLNRKFFTRKLNSEI